MRRLVARAKGDGVSASWLSALERSIRRHRIRMALRRSPAYPLVARVFRLIR